MLAAATRLLDADGDPQTSRHWFDLAYRAAEQAGDPDTMALAALGLAGVRADEHRTAEASALVQSRLEQALTLVDPRSPVALRLRIRLTGEADYRAGQHTAILAMLEEARHAADPLARMEALSLGHHCVLGPEHGELRRALAGELIKESSRTGHRSGLVMGQLWQTVGLFLDGDRHAERQLGDLRATLARRGHLAAGLAVGAIEVMLAIRAGRLAEAESLTKAAFERGTAAGEIDATGWYAAQLVAIRWYQGRLADLLPMLTELVHSPTLSAVDNAPFSALAVAAANAGDCRTAASTLARLCGRDLADLPRSGSWLATMHGIVEAAYLLDDAETAARAYQLLEPFAHLPVLTGLAVSCFGSAEHTLGVASLTTGDMDRAVEHFRRAVAGNLALGHWPALRASRMRYAEALTRRGLPEDITVAYHEFAAAEQDGLTMGLAAPGEPKLAESWESVGLPATCTREGRGWRVEVGTRSVLVGHSIGMLHLAVLLANPKAEIPAIELAAGVGALGNPGGGHTGMSAQPMLDPAAIRQYRKRLSQVRAEIDEIEASGEPERVARARAERDWLLGELGASTGHGGRVRRIPDSAEHARVAVGKAIRRAIARIGEADPLTGEHLRRRVHTGMRCWYLPG
jgi:hypothetical protein